MQSRKSSTNIEEMMKRLLLDLALTPLLFTLAFLARFKKKHIEVGLGPEPLINNIYHKKALSKYGYSCETFVLNSYFITSNFDIDFSKIIPTKLSRFYPYISFIFSIFRYKSLYIYFNGGPLYSTSNLLRALEPYLYKVSKIKIVVMPYGGDVTDYTSVPNLLFKYGLIHHYPKNASEIKKVKAQINRWIQHGDYIFSGADWVDYTFYWDKLMLAHFSIDTEEWTPDENYKTSDTFKVLHAPNHRIIKGTYALIKAVERLQDEGMKIELILLEKCPNSEVKKLIKEIDLVVDQLVIGWYAMLALEGMSSGKPVICFIREDLKKLYEYSGILEDQLPIISANQDSIYDQLKYQLNHRDELNQRGKASRAFVKKYHSIEVIGSFFDECNKRICLR
jgi:glycosyltransferase involved in cell wall biosynthesis